MDEKNYIYPLVNIVFYKFFFKVFTSIRALMVSFKRREVFACVSVLCHITHIKGRMKLPLNPDGQ
jgi:hypothetical protein